MGVCATSWDWGIRRPFTSWTVGLVLLFGGMTVPSLAAEQQAVAKAANQLTALVLREAAPGMRLDATANGPLVWTQYREPSGELVVELVNTTPAPEVTDIEQPYGLVEAVHVERLPAGDRPMTRLRISTRQDAVHELALDGNTLQLSLLPTEASAGEQVVAYEPLSAAPAQAAPPAAAEAQEEAPPVVADASPGVTSEAAAEESVVAPPAAVPAVQPAELATAAPVARPEPRRTFQSFGSAEQPLHGPEPIGVLASRLERVEMMPVDGGTEAAVSGDGEFRYSTFWLPSPPRFVVDLEGVTNLSPSGSIPWGGEAIQQVRIAQFQTRPVPVTRVVFDLNESAEAPVLGRDGEGLRVFFARRGTESRPSFASAAGQTPPGRAAADSHLEPQETPTVRASSEAEPSAVAFAAPASHRADPAAAGVERQGLPIAPEPEPGRVMLDQPTDVAYFEALQVEDSEIVPKAAGPEAPKYEALEFTESGKVYTGEPISFSLRDADIKEVLRSFAKISGLNIIIQPGVSGSVTVELEQVPWDQALEQILKINGLWYELDGNIMRIAPRSVLATEARQEAERQQAAALSVPLRTVIKRVSYARAGEVSALLTGSQRAGLLSQRGTVTVDSRTNTLIIKELPSFMDAVLAIITELDQPEPQVMIESRIIETTKNFSRSLGIEWGFDGVADNQHGNTTGLQFPNNVSGSGSIGLLTGGDNLLLDLALGNVLNTFTLNASLQAAEAEGLINVLSAPKVTVLNNEQAEIQSGLQIPIQTVSNNTVTVQFVNATLRLNVTPQVTAEGTVLLLINVQKREPQLAFAVAGAANAPIATREARTRVIVRDGGTTVIGGIYQVSTDEGQDRVPGLANIPILGRLFKNNRRSDRNEELLIFITPRVIKL